MKKSFFVASLLLLGVGSPWAALETSSSTGMESAPAPDPFQERGAPAGDKIIVGGPVGPDGKTEVGCDLPVSQRMKNTGGSDGSGLCVFTSVQNAARWQHETVLENFQAYMKKFPGGGYPEKLKRFIDRIADEKGIARPDVLQYEGSDPAVLNAALKTGRMPCVTYGGHCPHYGANNTIAHMVNLVALTDQYACILDNNFIQDNDLVWMSPQDFFKRWKMGGGGWAVILLSPPPPPVPHSHD